MENWVILLDLNKIGISALPISILKNLIKYLSSNYRGRMYTTYILNASNSIFIPWNIAKGFLEENTIKKIKFSKSHQNEELFIHAN